MKTSMMEWSSGVNQNTIQTKQKTLRSWYGSADERRAVQLYELFTRC